MCPNPLDAWFVVAFILSFTVAEYGASKSICLAATSLGTTGLATAASTFDELQQISGCQRSVLWYNGREEHRTAIRMVPAVLRRCKKRRVSLETISPGDYCQVSTQRVLSECCISWWQGAQLGGLKGTPFHLVLPYFHSRHIEGVAVAHIVTHQDEVPSLVQQLLVLFHGQRAVAEHIKFHTTCRKQYGL